MNYQQTIDYLYNTLPMFSRMGSAAYKKDITNTILLCGHLDNPHTKFKSIHVGGTNGKGSVSHALAVMFQSSGYKTGLHTSPHLYEFRERIKLNGEMIPEEFVIDFVEKIKPLAEKIQPSFFEITVAMAFDFFAKENVDIAIIEVGLGGRLDSTNIITPELSIITNIGWDHTNMLGNTLEEIAVEKAGIIKENIPVVIGESLPETKSIFEEIATNKQASVCFAEDEFEIDEFRIDAHVLSVSYKQENKNATHVTTDLTGIYQLKNIRTVLAAKEMLESKGWNLDNGLSGLQEVKKLTGLHGRWEVIQHNPTVVLEVAHNKNGIEQMLFHLEQLSFKRLHIIMGLVKDKDAQQILSLLPVGATYYFTQAHIPRALPAIELKQKARDFNLIGDEYNDVNIALHDALSKAGEQDIIIICGSIFLVAEVEKEHKGH